MLPEFLLWGLIVACGWCWAAFLLFIGMRFLNPDSKALRYGQATLLPFFVLHQTVMLAIAYFVVQWAATCPVKLLSSLSAPSWPPSGSSSCSSSAYGVLRILFGMKGEQAGQAQAASAPQRFRQTLRPLGEITRKRGGEGGRSADPDRG